MFFTPSFVLFSLLQLIVPAIQFLHICDDMFSLTYGMLPAVYYYYHYYNENGMKYETAVVAIYLSLSAFSIIHFL